MKLTRLSAQLHDYNLKLTKAELLAISYRSAGSDEEESAFWKMFDLIDKEADRLGGQQSEKG